MIVVFLKSLLYMLLFYFVIQMCVYIFKFVYFFISRKHNKNIPSNDQPNALNMLQCDKCKIYVVKSEAYMLNGKIFCKKEHADL